MTSRRAHIDHKVIKLKQEIKEWEYNFTKSHGGSKPTHTDIKSNEDIQLKYKKYNKYKKELKAIEEKENVKLQTPTKKVKASPASAKQQIPTSPFILKELGPTPQLKGRVLSIFDIDVDQDSPVAKHKQQKQHHDEDEQEIKSDFEHDKEEPVFKTPSKTRIQFHQQTPVSMRQQHPRQQQQQQDNVAETPMYLRQGSQPDRRMLTPRGQTQESPSMCAEPSPMFSPIRGKVKRKSLYEMMTELEQFKNDVENYVDEDHREAELVEKMINDSKIEESGAEITNAQVVKEVPIAGQDPASEAQQGQEQEKAQGQEPVDRFAKLRKKAKTQKRSTKRRKIRPLDVSQADEFGDVDIHERLSKMDQDQLNAIEAMGQISSDDDDDDIKHTERILNELEEENEEDEDEESSYDSESGSERDETAPVQEPNYKLLNSNFVRMKIHYKNRGKKNFGKKRR